MLQNNQIKTKLVIISAVNDLICDQRLHKVASSLQKIGFTPVLLGFKFKSTLIIQKRNYATKRINLFFRKGPLFYAEFNIKLFFNLVFAKSSILVANDLDTLLANYLAYRIKRIFFKNQKLVYDSHELFTELPELNGRPITQSIWLAIEKWILPKLKNSYTVCQPIADYYFEKYKIKMQIIRNMPISDNSQEEIKLPNSYLPENKKIILYQGALNIGRGIEQVIDAMEFIDNVVFVIVGSGTEEKMLRHRVYAKKLDEKVIFTGKIPFEILNHLTSKADIGLVLQDDISLSYRYVLPNRLFDFIRAGVPIIASALPEIVKIVEKEKIGVLNYNLESAEILKNLQLLLNNEKLIIEIKEAIKCCSSKYCWENEEEKLFAIYQNLH